MSLRTECDVAYNTMTSTQKSRLKSQCPTLYKQYMNNPTKAVLACLWAFTRVGISGTSYNQGVHGNTSYIWRNPPQGDCSALTYAAWKKAGVTIGHAGDYTSGDQLSYAKSNGLAMYTGGQSGTESAVKSGKVYIGDVFYYPGHVDIYVGDSKKVTFGSSNGLINSPSTADGSRAAGACTHVLQWGKKYGGANTADAVSGSTGKVKKEVWKYPTYNLSDNQLRHLAMLALNENESHADVEMSQMCNLYEYRLYSSGNNLAKRKGSLYAYIMTPHSQGGWYADNSYTGKNGHTVSNVTSKQLALAKSIFNEGKRILPPYIDEHDMFPLDAAIKGTWYNKSQDKSKYIQNKTTITQNPSRFKGGGSSYTFYAFYDDVYGWTSKKYKAYCEQKYRTYVYEDGTTSSGSSTATETEVEITNVTQKATWGKVGTNLNKDLLSWSGTNFSNKACELLIQQDNNIVLPPIEGEVEFTDERGCSCSTLSFNVLNVDGLALKRGQPVRFRHNKENVFYGYIFTTKQDSDDIIQVTAYDQLRYLKNQTSFVMSSMSYGDLIKYFCKNLNMKTGSIASPTYKLEKAIQEGSMLDMCESAYESTITNEGNAYVLYDDFGKVTLKKIDDMMLDILLDKNAIQDYEYEASIDTDVYNQIILAYDNQGTRELYTLNNQSSQNQWGVLSYYESLSSQMSEANIKKLAETYMDLYNTEQRTLSYKGVIGDSRVRGGTSFYVKHALHDYTIKTFMIVEKVTHKYSENEHWMDLTMIGSGGDFVAE